MIQRIQGYDPDAPVVVIDIGNTTTAVGTWHRDQVLTPLDVATEDPTAFEEAYRAHVEGDSRGRLAATIIASVVPRALERIRAMVPAMTEKEALVVGETVPLPMEVDVVDPQAIGVDRVCEAAAAYDRLRTGCIVVDFGTAVTVDLVDDDGVLLGGAILPGLRLQLQALHEHTALLPRIEPEIPALPYGRDTTQAMQVGVCRGLAGAVRALVEGYATHLHRWPQVIATGGDVAFMHEHCDFIDTLVSHLSLRGIGLAYSRHLADMGA